MQPIIVATTCSSKEEASALADLILHKRLAACVQITPTTSMYWWKTQIESDEEFLITMKSARSHFNSLAAVIKEHHSYEVPEIIATEITSIEQSYGSWLKNELLDLDHR